MTVQEYLSSTEGPVRRGITCKDGTFLSVQASSVHYCTPRSDYGPWRNVEVGHLSSPPPKSWEVFEDSKDVWAAVPIGLVDQFILTHGGMKE